MFNNIFSYLKASFHLLKKNIGLLKHFINTRFELIKKKYSDQEREAKAIEK